MLSALHEPNSRDVLSEKEFNRKHLRQAARSGATFKILAIDPSGKWMHEWRSRFEALAIPFLRSPMTAHPDLSDPDALASFYHRRCSVNGTASKGVYEVDRSSWNPQQSVSKSFLSVIDTGLYDRPSTALFDDFCDELVAKYPHTLVQGVMADVKPHETDGYIVSLADGRSFRCRRIVLATGNGGVPVVPLPFQPVVGFDSCSPVVHTGNVSRAPVPMSCTHLPLGALRSGSASH